MKKTSRTRKSLLYALLSSSLLWHLPMTANAADEVASTPEQTAAETDSSQRELSLKASK